MITATLASVGPIASIPADTVLACAEMFLLVKSFATLANSFLNASALCGDIISVARSMDAVGFCGVNVADASDTLLAIPTTSAVSLRSVRSGTVQFRYPTTTPATKAVAASAVTPKAQEGTVVVRADRHPVAARKRDIDRDALDHQQAQHRADRHPPQRPCQAAPMYTRPAIAAIGGQDVESQYAPTVSHRIGSRREISSWPSTSETSSRRVQRTVCGFSAPAVSLTDVATTITVSVRDADSDSSG